MWHACVRVRLPHDPRRRGGEMMDDDDIDAIAEAVARRVLERLRSGPGIAVPVEGEDLCDEAATNGRFMDPTSTAASGASRTSEDVERAARLFTRNLIRNGKPKT